MDYVSIGDYASGERSRVLAIVGQAAHGEVVQDCLDKNRYDLLVADKIDQGLEVSDRFYPEVVLLDLSSLQDLNAQDACLRLKNHESTACSLLIVLADRLDDEAIRIVSEAGADDFLFFPFQSGCELDLRLQGRMRRLCPCWHEQGQNVLMELTHLLASSLDLNQVLHKVAVRCAEILKVDRCSFVLIHPDGKTGKVAAASEDASLCGIEVDLNRYPEIQEVIKSQVPLVIERVEDRASLKEILPALEKNKIGSLALYPMIYEERVDGVLFLRSNHFRQAPNKSEIFFANTIAAFVALVLRNIQAVKRERKIGVELQRTKQFMENLIDSSVDAIVAADMKGEIILFNKGAERLFGYRAEDVIGKLHVTRLYPSGVAYEIMKALRSKDEDDIGHLNTSRKEVINKNGEVVPIQLTAWTVMDDDQEVATAGIFTDLRERLKIERKLSLAQERLMRTEKQAMIAELAGATAHELNQPLTSVLGYAELAKIRIAKKEGINHIMETILSEAMRMAEIVRKLGRITSYETKSYIGEQRIMDIERSSEPD